MNGTALVDAAATKARRAAAEYERVREQALAGDLDDVGTLPVVTLDTLDASPPAPLILDRLDPIEGTILFGPGGVGKGTLAASWIAQLANAGRPVLILDYEGHPGEWARRIGGLQGDMTSVAYLAPLRAGLGAIWEHADQIALLAKDNPGMVVVIDSAVMACAGHDPMDPETPSRYFGALQMIGVPSLTLAHVTKMHDPTYPFGSVFWHTLARMTWSLMPKGEDVVLTCRKASNYLKPPAYTVSYTWMDGVLREVWERKAIVTLTERILETLADGPMTTADIAGTLNDGLAKDEHTSVSTVRMALSREMKRGRDSRVTKDGDQWRLLETES